MNNASKIIKVLKLYYPAMRDLSWELDAHLIIKHCSHPIDKNAKINWYKASSYLPRYAPEWLTLYPELINWTRATCIQVIEYCPEKIIPKKFNWKNCTANLAFAIPKHPLLETHGIWDNDTIKRIKFYRIAAPNTARALAWKGINIYDLENPKKRKIILEKVNRALTLAKI